MNRKTVRIAFLGDVMLGRRLNEVYPQCKPQEFWGSTLPLLTGADAVLANLECATTTHKEQWQRTPKVFHFGADPAAIEVLQAANVKYVSLANNHILDFEEEGLLDTLNYLNSAGIAHAGAGRNMQEAMQPALFAINQETPKEFRIGVIALTDNEPAFSAESDNPGTWYMPIRADDATLEPIKKQVEGLRAQHAGLIVLSVHWGPNMVQEPSSQFQDFAQAVIDLGVDIIHGHSAHIFQGVVLRDDKLIFYDTGDFLDDYAVDPGLRNDWSFIFLVEVDHVGLIRLEMLPVRLRLARVDLATGEEFKAICARMQKLSSAFDTPVAKTERGLEVKIRQEADREDSASS